MKIPSHGIAAAILNNLQADLRPSIASCPPGETFAYAYEPYRNHIESCEAETRLVLAPGRQPANWTEAEPAKGLCGDEDGRVLPHPSNTADGSGADRLFTRLRHTDLADTDHARQMDHFIVVAHRPCLACRNGDSVSLDAGEFAAARQLVIGTPLGPRTG